jgi:hypothetical protein
MARMERSAAVRSDVVEFIGNRRKLDIVRGLCVGVSVEQSHHFKCGCAECGVPARVGGVKPGFNSLECGAPSGFQKGSHASMIFLSGVAGAFL